MDKTRSKKSKTNGIVKGVALGFACVLSSAFFPSNVITLAENYNGIDNVGQNTNRIEVNGNVAANDSSFVVNKGDSFVIPVGEYYGKSTSAHKIGTVITDDSSVTASYVDVIYSATGDRVGSRLTGLSGEAIETQKFVANRIGKYTITYTVIDNGQLYTYDVNVTCQASSAEFEFENNGEHVLPTIYDVKLAGERDIVIPLPSINDEDGEEILNPKDNKANYYIEAEGQGLPNNDDYVLISITNGSEDLSITADENGDFIIEGGTISEALDGKNFTINYALYQGKENGGVFIASTTQTFSVKDGYYFTSSDKKESGYELEATLSTKPDTAVVGVARTLPTVTGRTKTGNYPSSETVNVSYKIEITKMDTNGKYTIPVDNADVITESGQFKAKEEGSYKFVYIVEDFYENEAPKANTTFTIENVKDSLSPDVYMYDAGDYSIDSETGAYTSAESKLKSQTENRNIVMYAIAGVDNMVEAEDLTLKREVLDSAGITRIEITEKKYNAYNLIFAPSKGSSESVYKSIVSDNFEIERQIIVFNATNDPTVSEKQDVDLENDDSIKTWLIDNNYLIVTSTNKDFGGNEIVAESEVADPSEISEETTQKFIDAGYAFVKPNSTTFTFISGSTYTFRYSANDNINNNKDGRVSFDIKTLSSFTDNSAPVITFSTDLHSTYFPGEKITFKTITSSDVSDSGVDTDLEIVTAYRYLKNGTSSDRSDVPTGKVVVAGEETTSTLSYVALRTTSANEQEYYFAGRNENNMFTSKGWFIDKDASSYNIDLSKKPVGAEYVEILCYAIDDYGNIGFFNKIVRIADTSDVVAPILYKIVGAPGADDSFEAPMTINLPMLEFTDDNVNYMSASVKVYKMTGSGADTTKQLMASSGMTTDVDSYRDIFTVNAGTFNASSEGRYQVAITVTDSGNHSLTTFFNYDVKGTTIVEEPEITNITSQTIELECGKGEHLKTPRLSVTTSQDYGYIGIGDKDDANNSTYYTTSIISSTSNDYDLDNHYFIGNSEGTYKLKYKVFLLKYSKDASIFAETRTDNKLYLDADGKLKYATSAENYYVYLEKNTDESDVENPYVIACNTSLQGFGNALTGDALQQVKNNTKIFAMESKVQTFSVKGYVMNVELPDDAYKKTSYEELGEEITILKPTVTITGSYGVNQKDTKVTITYSSNSSSSETLATISLDDWTVVEGSDFRMNGQDIVLKLARNGQYKITYSAQAQDEYGANVGDPQEKSFTIGNGDRVPPKLEIASDMFKTKYALGDSISIEFLAESVLAGEGDITMSDTVSEIETLLESLTVTLKSPSSSTETLENESEQEGTYRYTRTFDEAGDYTITFTIKDGAGNSSDSQSFSFTVETKESTPVDVKDVLGKVLIGVSCAMLAGVVIYFIVSKVKLDKKERAYKNKK